MYVTLHLAAGQTIKQLITEVAELSGGGRVRGVSGRMGVLVDSELAYRYLAIRHAPPAPEVVPALPPEPEPVPASIEVADVAPAPPPPVKKATPAKKAKAAAIPKGE